MKQHRLTSDQWSQFWSRDTVTTFVRPFDGNYDEEFADFWNTQFSRLADGARVVDLATGNGAIALLAQSYSIEHGKALELVGIDYAEIDPAGMLAAHENLQPLLAGIEFRGGVRIEATGLDDASVDLLTSQYGFEYADAIGAVAEASRVLKPGGRMALILHHVGSTVVEHAREGLDQVQFCLQKEEIDKRVAALVTVMGEAVTPEQRRALKSNRKAESLRKKLNASLTRIKQRSQKYTDPEGFMGVMVPNLLKVFSDYKEAGTAQKLKHIRDVRAAFDAYRERMADLAGAALSPAMVDALVERFEAAGFVVEKRGSLHYKGSLMGWTLELEKPVA
ncbi:MAG: class I SAM-dependent methyltransferase [Gammaproteobacteria bacterium]|nr:class I SAM-dependent methyltransferase [Gammaproteobacteria bacterium]MDH3506321.1 class I SAM-dependent methyltransferase [Gammaproteobacteria bacterium]